MLLINYTISWFICNHYLLTLLEVVCLPDVDEDERHELQLREALPRGRGQREEVPQVRDLRVDHVPPHLGRALRRLPVRPDAALNDGGATIIYSSDFLVKGCNILHA